MDRRIITAEEAELLDAEWVASDLKVSLPTLANWRTAGRGPAFVKVGRYPKYPLLDYRRWKATRPRIGGDTSTWVQLELDLEPAPSGNQDRNIEEQTGQPA